MRRFIVWAVYGTVDHTVNVRVAEYSYKQEREAREHAARLQDGYTVQEKVEKMGFWI